MAGTGQVHVQRSAGRSRLRLLYCLALLACMWRQQAGFELR